MKKALKWIIIAAARPNFMKIAPLIRSIATYNRKNGNCIRTILIHTGQHYDDNMSEAFFRDLNIPAPDIHMGIGSGSHAEQTGHVMIAFEKVLIEEKPDLVIVVGDVNSTLACSIAAVKLNIPVAHVEAGLRSFDRTMPEEINRIVTDAISNYLFTPSPDGDENLLHEGVTKERIFLVGDIMVDSLLFNLDNAKKTDILNRLGLHPNSTPYALLTLHRPSNVDNYESLTRIIQGLLTVAERIPIIFFVHPRTRKQIKNFDLETSFTFHPSQDLAEHDYYEKKHDGRVAPGQLRVFKRTIHAFAPLGYLEFLNLMAHAKIVLTDSGGIQEETTVLNIPCITLRDTTERPITLTEGTNVLVHDDPEKIVAEVGKILNGKPLQASCPAIWDGHTADRIVNILADNMKINDQQHIQILNKIGGNK